MTHKNRFFWTLLLTAFVSMQAHAMELDQQLLAKIVQEGNKGNIATISELLQQVTNLQAKRHLYDGNTLLHYAVRFREYEATELLIAHGADVNVMNDIDKKTPIFEASRTDIAELLFTHGANLNVTDTYGNTPLHHEPARYLYEIAKWLIEHKANVNAVDHQNKTPLHATRCKEVAELLIAHGANVKAVDKDGDTPLHEAAHIDDTEIIELFIEKGADIHAEGYLGTPLHVASSNGQRGVAEILIDKGGADVNRKNSLDETPLHFAARNGHNDLVELLLMKGANPELKDILGKKPLDHLAKNASN